MVNAKVIKVKETLCGGCYLSANLAIMAWIPLAESSRVLMKKSLRFGLQWKLFWLKKKPDVGHEVGEAEEAVCLRVFSPLQVGVGGQNIVDGANDFIHTLNIALT